MVKRFSLRKEIFQSDFGEGLSLELSLKLTALVFARQLKTSVYIQIKSLTRVPLVKEKKETVKD